MKKPKKSCPVCGSKFIPKHKNHKYCSVHCKQQNNKGCLPKKKCKFCGKLFKPWNTLQQFCNVVCYNKQRQKNCKIPSRRIKSVVRVCEECGKEFHPYSRSTGKFCSPDCYWTNYRKNHPPQTKKCEICGKDFVPWSRHGSKNRPPAKYCSHTCAGLGITQNKRKSPKAQKARKTTSSLDNLWRQLVYQRANNRCEYCGKSGRLNAHHVFSRSNYSVRWDLDNGVCLCVSHHIFGQMSFHKAPIEMLEWLKETRGEKWYKRLRKKARTIRDVRETKEEALKILKKEKEL